MYADDYSINNSKQQGFTLIELSILMIIVGLIIAGILSGKDLITNSQIRAVILQDKQFDQAVSAFKDQYGGLPGDYLPADGTAGVNFTLNGKSVTAGNGDSQVTDGGASTSGYAKPTGELFWFWADLLAGNYIGTQISTTMPTLASLKSLSAAQIYNLQLFPQSKLGRNSVWVAFNVGAIPYYQLGAISTDANSYMVSAETALTPFEASSIDTKIDDGFGDNGVVQAMGAGAGAGVALDVTPATNGTSGQSGKCLVTGTAGAQVYNTVLTSPACQLRFDANW